MARRLSHRLNEIAASLPLSSGIRVLEIGCGPGVLAREISKRLEQGFVLGIDRSDKAIRIAVANSGVEIEAGRLYFRHVALEDFRLEKGELPYDLAVAVRVGCLDGRHPELEQQALIRVAAALVPRGKLFIDGGQPLKEIQLLAKR